MASLLDLANNLFNQGKQKVQQVTNPILAHLNLPGPTQGQQQFINGVGNVLTAPGRFTMAVDQGLADHVPSIAQGAFTGLRDTSQSIAKPLNTMAMAPFERNRIITDTGTDALLSQIANRRGNTQLANRYTQRSQNLINNYKTNLQQANEAYPGAVTKAALLAQGSIAGAGALTSSLGINALLQGGMAKLQGKNVDQAIGNSVPEGIKWAGFNNLIDKGVAKLGVENAPLFGRAVVKGAANLGATTGYNALVDRRKTGFGEAVGAFALPAAMEVGTDVAKNIIKSFSKPETLQGAQVDTEGFLRNKAGQLYDTVNGRFVKATGKAAEALKEAQTKFIESAGGGGWTPGEGILVAKPDGSGLMLDEKAASRLQNQGGFVKIGSDGSKFEAPYKRGDISVLQKELDQILGTESFNSTGKWKATLPARETAIQQLEHYANTGDPEAVTYLNKARGLINEIETAQNAKGQVQTLSKDLSQLQPSPISPNSPPDLSAPTSIDGKLSTAGKEVGQLPGENALTNTIDRTQLTGQQLSTPNEQLSFPEQMDAAKVQQTALKETGQDPNVSNQPQLPEVTTTDNSPEMALSKLIDENGKVLPEVKDTFSNWVKARQAAPVQEYVRKQEFKPFDAQGLQGIIDFQSGNNPELNQVKQFFDQKYQALSQAGVDFGYKDNYLPQLWKNSPEQVQEIFGKKLGFKPGFTMDSVIQDYQTGIAAGLEPKFTKISDLVGWYEGKANKALADKTFFDNLMSNGLIQPSGKVRNWAILDPDRFPKYSTSLGGEGQYTGTYSAPKELADLVNNYLKTPEGPVAGFANYASKVKNIALSGGIPGTGINAHGVNILARNTLAADNPVSGFLTGAKYLIAPNQAEKYINQNLAKTEFAAKAGVTFNLEDTSFDKLMNEESKGLKGLSGKLSDIRDKWFDKPLFGKVIPALKVQYFDNVFSNLKGQVGEEQAAKSAAEITNNIFGGINAEAMGRNREGQNILRSLVLAPDWAETQLRVGGNIIKGSLKATDPQLKAYRTFARNMVLAYVAANAANKATSGHYLWENDPGHTTEIEAGYTNDGKKRYIRPLGTAADFARIPYDVALSVAKGDLSSVSRVIRNRLSIPAGVIAGAVTNTDYLGRKQFGNGIPIGQQLGAVANNTVQLAGFPSQASAAIDYASGKSNGEQALSQVFELPTRYAGGAYSKTQKAVTQSLQGQGLQGKDLYDANKSLQGESLSPKQMQAVGSQGKAGLDQILKARTDKRAASGGKLSNNGISQAYASETGKLNSSNPTVPKVIKTKKPKKLTFKKARKPKKITVKNPKIKAIKIKQFKPIKIKPIKKLKFKTYKPKKIG